MRFLLLVPLRRDEAAGLAWSEVDLQLRRIRIQANRAKMREPHELPLSASALALLEARKPKAANALVSSPQARISLLTDLTVFSLGFERGSAKAKPQKPSDLFFTISGER